MSAIRRFFKGMEESRKKQVSFFCASMTVLIVIYFTFMVQFNKRFEIVGDNFSWVYQIDSMEEQNENLQIAGWAFALNQDAETNGFEIVLHDIETGKKLYPKMTYEPREDVNSYFVCEYDYRESGFFASLPLKKMENNIYEVLVRPSEKKYAFSTGIYYVDGKMMFVNPDEYVPLDVAGTDIEKVVKDGVLRVYRPDYGMYVYQYRGELYWIAEEKYGFVDGDTYVQFQMNTTQFDRLPEDRLMNGWNWSNIGFMFCENELVHWNTGEYRVAKYTLPKEYSITQIWTGNYINEWIWMQNFRPWYEFK